MFIVSLTYKCEVSEIEKQLKAHIEFLDKYYQSGVFIASGRKVPRTGGIIMARCESKAALESILAEDPFASHQLADYEIIEFAASKFISELAALGK
ncbi:YciI family protein [Celerinatantimonas sp. MCCC 1A17872]|uniref:YciI family protein n=1 Tax=Celerinatantimonas sp. MCCC 1A17872 TaxID=3177514 RepID=UPI0038C1411B